MFCQMRFEDDVHVERTPTALGLCVRDVKVLCGLTHRVRENTMKLASISKTGRNLSTPIKFRTAF